VTVTIRQLRPDEWPAFRDLRLKALRLDGGNFFRTVDEERDRPVDHWREMLESDDSAVFGLFDRTMLVGITAVYVDRAIVARDTAGLGMTWLEPAYRGRGLSATIYAARIAWARGKGLTRIIVSHREGNEPSRRAMLAHAFRRTGAAPHAWPDGRVVNNISYELPL
jgi:RimJ/RimL family protein N-acetyltransferase